MSVPWRSVSSKPGVNSIARCQRSPKSTTQRIGTINVTEYIFAQTHTSGEPQKENVGTATVLSMSTRRLFRLAPVNAQHVIQNVYPLMVGITDSYLTFGFLTVVYGDGLPNT
jgi:hypothetical protein